MKLNTPKAIIISSIIVGFFVFSGIIASSYISNKVGGQTNQASLPDSRTQNNAVSPEYSIPEFNPKIDKYMGNPDAPVQIIEYSDFECPFCKKFHETMQEVIEKYPEDVLWVYRHFPLESIHPTARIQSIASECAYTQSGNDGFWQFTNRLFEVTKSNGLGDPYDQIEQALEAVDNINNKKFYECLDNEDTDWIVAQNISEAQRANFNATPTNVIIFKDTGRRFVLRGAQSVGVITTIIKQAKQEESNKDIDNN